MEVFTKHSVLHETFNEFQRNAGIFPEKEVNVKAESKARNVYSRSVEL